MNEHLPGILIGLLFIFLIFFAPLFVAWDICKNRNRNPWKGLFLAFFFGWLAVAGLWLALKIRDPVTKILH